ncbi:ArsR/SmtB family transcription factor [Corynebacterium qintianiae]|nr:metalloregulator ArsR/SmtB family transcription factor [Corynebacterium qintianiae]
MGNMEGSPPPDLERTAELVSALDSPLRLQILLLLNDSPHVVHQIVGKLGESQPLVSQHLRVLKKSRLVGATRFGREVVYELAEPGIIDVIYELADLATLEEARDEVAARRRGRTELRSGSGAAAIVDPPSDVRPARDPGLLPHTPDPTHD